MACLSRGGEFFINEILFNPPGLDAPNEYVEIRGPSNAVLPAGTYLVGIEGDAASNPGVIQDVFDLSGRLLGANGLLVLLQKTNLYTPASPFCRVVVQTGPEPGWGHGGNSTVRHKGEAGATDIENPSVTFMLIASSKGPSIGDDIDANDDGVPDGDVFARWTVLDSVGVLDADGPGDIAYGAVNFRRSTAPGSGAYAGGTVIPVPFTPAYVARAGNSTGNGAADWVAGDNLSGAAPAFALSDAAHTYPASLAGAPLNHIGAPNFGAPVIAGVALVPPGPGSLQLTQGIGSTTYTLELTRPALGDVVIAVEADEGLEVSPAGVGAFGARVDLHLSAGRASGVDVRAVDRNSVDPSPRTLQVRHRILDSSDPSFTAVSVPSLPLAILNPSPLVLTEVMVNPLGADDHREFVELRGNPNATLHGVYLLEVETDPAANQGVINWLVPLDGQTLGSEGLLMVASPGHPYHPAATTTVVLDPRMAKDGGVLPNGPFSLLLVSTAGTLREGDDLDQGGNGQLEGLPHDATVLDSIAWLHGDGKGEAYGTLLSDAPDLLPDAATRFPGDLHPNTAEAWFFGDLKDTDPAGLRYDRQLSSSNLPAAAVVTPGVLNDTPPTLTHVDPLSGAVGDPTNPGVVFTVADGESPASLLSVSAASSNPAVVGPSGLHLTSLGGGSWRLDLSPVGAGYSQITLMASDGQLTNQVTFRYAASNDGDDRTRYLVGAGDGSTAILLPGNLILVGDDENEVIRMYDRNRSGMPLAQFDFTPALGLTDFENGIPREVDIEASTRAGDRLFWLGAHSHASNTEARTNRSRVFATDLRAGADGVSLAYVGRYDFLKLDLVDWDSRNLHGKGTNYYGLADSTREGVDPKAVDGSGFNLEGLTMAPGSLEMAYIGCRAPLAPASGRTHALIIPVLNFATLAAGNGPPGTARFGPPIELDLFGRGIRSLEGVGTNFLIVAGPAGPSPTNYPADFRLYTWSGDPGDPPHLRSTSLRGLNPEGIVELPATPWTPDREVQLLSDCGTRVWYGDGVITKELSEVNFKKCRLDWVTLGEEVLPEPVLLEARATGTSLTLKWRGAVGVRHQVQWRDDLVVGEWHDLAPAILTTAPINSTPVDLSPNPRRYFRIVSVQP